MTTARPTDEQLAAWLLGDLADPEAGGVERALAQDPGVAERADRLADVLGRLDLAAGLPAPPGYAARLDAGLAARLGVAAATADLAPTAAAPMAPEPAGPAGSRPGSTRPRGTRPRSAGPAGGRRAGRRRTEQLLPGLAALLLVVAVSAVGLRSFRDGALPSDVPATATDPADATTRPSPDPGDADPEDGTPGGEALASAAEEPAPGPTPRPTAGAAGDGSTSSGPSSSGPTSSGPGSSGPTSPAGSAGTVAPGGDPATPGQGGAAADDAGTGDPSPPPGEGGEVPGDADGGAGGQGGGEDAGPTPVTRPEDPPPSDAEAAGGGAGTTGDEPATAPAPGQEQAIADEPPSEEGQATSASSPTIADVQADLPDVAAVDAQYGSRPESAQVLGLSGPEAEERASAHAAEVRAAAPFPSSGEPPDRCLDAALQGQATAVVVAVETVAYVGEPGLAYLVVRGDQALDRADVTIVGADSCTPLLVRDVAV